MKRFSLGNVLSKYVVFFILVALIILFSFLSPYFLTLQNLTNVFVQNSYVIIAAVGLAFVMISGGMDLSIGYQMSLVGIVTCMLMKNAGMPVGLSVIAGLILGALLGIANGTLAIRLKVHPLIVTLGAMTVYQGISYTISNSKQIMNLPQAFKFIGQGYVFGFVPVSVVMMIVVVIVASFILNKTYLGRYIYSIGSNQDAAFLAGVDVKKIKLFVFSFCGFLVAVSSMVLFARTGSGASSTGPGTEFTCMTAAILGGISFKGGEGKIWGVVAGVLILGVLSNGMQLIGMNTYAQYIVKGFVLLAAVGFDTYQKDHAQKVLAMPEGRTGETNVVA